MKLLKTSRKFHKWLMLFLGAQFVIWSVTGAYMLFFNIDYIHGDTLVVNHQNKIDVNNIQIILFAFITLWLSLMGLIWTIDLGLRGQYQIKFFAKQQGVKLFDKNQKSMGTVTLSSHINLLDGLIGHDIALPSTCGGGGPCGRCKVMINPIVKTTSADYLHFTDDKLQQGYRLACQNFSYDVEHMTLIDVTDAKKHSLVLSDSHLVSPYMKELR